MHEATLLDNVPPECDVVKEEVFGPVVVMDRYATFKDAIAKCVPWRGRPSVPVYSGTQALASLQSQVTLWQNPRPGRAADTAYFA